MGFVWNSLEEFPYTKNYDDDLRESLKLMIELRKVYGDILNNLNYLKEQFEELEKEFNELPALVQALENKVDRVIAETNARMDSLENEFEGLTKEYEKLKELVKTLEILYDDFGTLIDTKIRANNIMIYNRIAELGNRLENEIEELREEIANIGRHDLFNRLEGFVQPIGEVVQDYYEGLRTHAITNSEYDQLQLTNNQFAAFRLTNRIFNSAGRDWLNHFFQFTGINPVTGHKTRESNVNSYLLTLFLGTRPNSYWDLTNDEYSALNLTNEERLYYDRVPQLPQEL
jgi:hypothetical protein